MTRTEHFYLTTNRTPADDDLQSLRKLRVQTASDKPGLWVKDCGAADGTTSPMGTSRTYDTFNAWQAVAMFCAEHGFYPTMLTPCNADGQIVRWGTCGALVGCPLDNRRRLLRKLQSLVGDTSPDYTDLVFDVRDLVDGIDSETQRWEYVANMEPRGDR